MSEDNDIGETYQGGFTLNINYRTFINRNNLCLKPNYKCTDIKTILVFGGHKPIQLVTYGDKIGFSQ